MTREDSRQMRQQNLAAITRLETCPTGDAVYELIAVLVDLLRQVSVIADDLADRP